MHLTINQIADTITAAESRSDRDRIFQQIRGLQQRGLLKHADTGGPKGAYRFSEFEACASRIFLSALDQGISGSELERLSSALRHARRASFPTGDYEIGLAVNIERIHSNEEPWAIEMARNRDVVTGQLLTGFAWVRFDPRGINRFGEIYADPFAVDASRGSVYVEGGVDMIRDTPIEAVAYIKVATILAPLIKAIRQADEAAQ